MPDVGTAGTPLPRAEPAARLTSLTYPSDQAGEGQGPRQVSQRQRVNSPGLRPDPGKRPRPHPQALCPRPWSPAQGTCCVLRQRRLFSWVHLILDDLKPKDSGRTPWETRRERSPVQVSGWQGPAATGPAEEPWFS